MLQEIYMHKTKLMNLINNLINTQLINEEININNEIKKESEFLNSLLNIKQNFLMNQNNNFNFNPFMLPPNPIINAPQMNLNMNQFQFNPQKMNNNYNKNYNEKKWDLLFVDSQSSKTTTIHCNKNDKISEVIEKYKNKANDYNNNLYTLKGKILNSSLNSTIIDFGCFDRDRITVSIIGAVKGGP